MVAVVIGAQFLVLPPAGYCREGWTPPAAAAGAGRDFSTGQMLGTLHFYLLWVMHLFGCTAGLMIIGLAEDIGEKLVSLSAAEAALIGFCFGGFLALFPSVTADYYGTQNVGTNYGLMFLAYGTAAIVGPKVGTSVPFTQAFLVAAVLCLIAGLLSLLVRKPPQLKADSGFSV